MMMSVWDYFADTLKRRIMHGPTSLVGNKRLSHCGQSAKKGKLMIEEDLEYVATT